ncbi:MAG: hypothetical protein DRI69_08470 [Bacteroidetes bacterium]|nr:MAG: hypothetical protein DRI69_08470 [Bacteroidota bacterium]
MEQNVLQSAAKAVKNWWLLALLGICLILLGLWVFRNPGGTLLGLATFFSIMLFISSISSIVFALTNRETMQGWGRNLAAGIFELMIAIVLLRNPLLAGLALNFLIGFWVMFRGINLISMGLELRNYGLENWGWVFTGGVLASVLAFFILIDPLAGAVTVAVWAGMSLIMAGIFNIFVAMILRRVKLKTGDIKEFVQAVRDTES